MGKLSGEPTQKESRGSTVVLAQRTAMKPDNKFSIKCLLTTKAGTDLRDRVRRAVDTIQYVCVSEEDWFGFFETLTIAEKSANQESINDQIFKEEELDFKIPAQSIHSNSILAFREIIGKRVKNLSIALSI